MTNRTLSARTPLRFCRVVCCWIWAGWSPALAGTTAEIEGSIRLAPSASDWTVSGLTLPRLDPVAGRLVEVRFRFDVPASQVVSIENGAPTSVTVLVQAAYIVSVSTPAGVLAMREENFVPPAFELGPFDGVTDFAGPSGFNTRLESAAPPDERIFYPGDPIADQFVGSHGAPGQLFLFASSQSASAVTPQNNMTILTPGTETGIELTVTIVFDPEDCNHNQNPDELDVLGGSSPDCDQNLFPDECQGDLDSDGIPDACDLDCAGPGPDTDGDGLLDDCDTITDCDNDGIPDSVEVDRNHNGLTDTCEFSGDCNGNGLPDLLDIHVGTSEDGDLNDVPDECQSAGLGFFQDGSCVFVPLCHSRPNSTGVPATLTALGGCRPDAGTTTLSAAGLPPGRTALFFEGRIGLPVFTNLGARCVTGPMRRLGSRIADAAGNANVSIDLAEAFNAGIVHPWELRGYQVAFRDGPFESPTPGLSDAVLVRYMP